MPSVGEGQVSDRHGYDRGTPIERYDIERFLRAADLLADLNVPGSLPVGSFDCVILTQVLQFLSPETAWPTSGHRSPPVGS
jgi:hypothetical protein